MNLAVLSTARQCACVYFILFIHTGAGTTNFINDLYTQIYSHISSTEILVCRLCQQSNSNWMRLHEIFLQNLTWTLTHCTYFNNIRKNLIISIEYQSSRIGIEKKFNPQSNILQNYALMNSLKPFIALSTWNSSSSQPKSHFFIC